MLHRASCVNAIMILMAQDVADKIPCSIFLAKTSSCDTPCASTAINSLVTHLDNINQQRPIYNQVTTQGIKTVRPRVRGCPIGRYL